jgi:enamine deaminase RidA (YjgF/YER057c/UK114 family)
MSHNRVNYSSGAHWENIVGYSRAVRIGNVMEISGTTAIDENNNIIGENNVYLQTKFIIQKIEAVLLQAGATLNDVVRTRMFVTDITNWEEVGKAHGEYFSQIKPCTSIVEVKALIAPQFLIEIEATAVLEN